jgi:hypothetical protein
MDLRNLFYKHPYANMVTVVFVFSILVTIFYFFGLIPGVRKTLPGFARLRLITGVLFAVTVAVWIAAIGLGSVDDL